MHEVNYDDQHFFPSLCLLSEQLSLVTCKQSADYFTPVLWFDFIRWRVHFIMGLIPYLDCNKYSQNDITQYCVSSKTHNWYMYTTWEMDKQNLGFTQMASQGGEGGQNILLILAPMCFLWNNLWSVCCCIMGPFSSWWRLNGKSQWYLTIPFEKVGNKLVITDSYFHLNYTFASKLHIWQQSSSIFPWAIACRRCDKPGNIQFMKSLEKYTISVDVSLNMTNKILIMLLCFSITLDL